MQSATTQSTDSNTATSDPKLVETFQSTMQALNCKSLWPIRKHTAHFIPLSLAMWLVTLSGASKSTKKN